MPGDRSLPTSITLGGAVRDLYRQGQTDYWLEPMVMVDALGTPVGRVQDGDVVLFCCRRGEREIQLTEAFVDPKLDRFPRARFQDLMFVILTLYHAKFAGLPVAFAPTSFAGTLGEIVSRAGLRQLRVAESEKFAHITYFLNGGRGEAFPGEQRVRVPSPHGTPVDQVPELRLAQITREILRGIEERCDLVVANFANGDVLGHTQNCEAKIECAARVDACLGQVVDAAVAANMVTVVTADHGNLEEMTRPDGSPHVSHTTNLVPFIVIDPRGQVGTVRDGRLADVAPTVLDALRLEAPIAMSGKSLAPDSNWGGPRRVLLLILDGWGIGKNDATNPIWLAPTPVWDELIHSHPFAQLEAAGEAVGLRMGKPGNSEAGHMNIGAGRIVLQDDVRIDRALADGSLAQNEILCRAIGEAGRKNGRLHLIGLLSEKSSHGTIDYPLALLRLAAANGLRQVYLHLIFDGRSTQPGTAPALIEDVQRQVSKIGVGQIVSGIGRGIALDRDGDYDKTRRAYDALVFGIGKPYTAE